MWIRLIAIGVVAGVFSSLFGVGGGIVIVPLLLYLTALQTRQATSVSLGAILITAVAGVTAYAFRGQVDIAYAALVGVPAVGGALLGTALQQRVRQRLIRAAFAVMLAAVGIWLIAG